MPKLKDKRISGTGYDPETMEGKAAIRQLKHSKKSKDNKLYEIDTDKIKNLIDTYISSKIIIDYDTNEIIGFKEVSRAGLRRYIKISRNQYLLWLKGYVSESDKDNEDVVYNYELEDSMREADDFITQVLSETWGKQGEQTRIKLMEGMGEIPSNKTEINANIRIGGLTKPKNWKKGSK
jgi:hypothetical protein